MRGGSKINGDPPDWNADKNKISQRWEAKINFIDHQVDAHLGELSGALTLACSMKI